MRIRSTHSNDAAAVGHLLERAYPLLMAPSYEAHVLARALPTMTTAKPDLLASGTYYVAENAGRIVGCGGWTSGQPGSGRLEDGLAHLRHFATDPAVVRQGIGRAIFARCAADAALRGAARFRVFASLNAEPFYRSLGLGRLDVIAIPIGPDATLPVVLMEGAIPGSNR